MIKALLFDFDGTLYDTNDVNYYAYKAALSDFGFTLDYDFYCNNCNGRNYKEFIPELVGYDQEITEQVHDKKVELYPTFLDKAKINTNLFDLIDLMKMKCKVAIVTTASRKNVLNMLEATGKADVFDLLVCGDDVTKYKPDPECYNLAMEKLHVLPNEVAIFEDSIIGVKAAKAANAAVYIVNN
jgi:beta-phosphoglucomutase